jgi:Cof subfamily protein (haloacid dehalogenase superfamily)
VNSIKLLVIDIDGTLMMRAGEISAEDRVALTEARKKGILISLCSGRAIQTGRLVADNLGLDGYHMFFDGGLVANPQTGEHVYMRTIPDNLVRQAVDFAHSNNLIIDLWSATAYFAEKENWVTDIRRDYFGVVPRLIDFDKLPRNEGIIKATLVVRSAEEKSSARRFRDQFSGSLTLSSTVTPAFPDVDFINVLSPGVSKKTALEALLRHINITLDQVMAIGDGINDMPVIASVGIGVAMGNAPNEVKAAADYVTLDADHNGVAEAIKKFLLC